MANEKVTKKDMFNAIMNFVAGTSDQKFDVDGMVAFCQKEIASLDAKAAKAKEKAAEKKAEPDVLKDKVEAALTDEFQTLADICLQIEDENATVGKIQNRLNKLGKEGIVEKTDIKIPATEEAKARTVKGYKKVN